MAGNHIESIEFKLYSNVTDTVTKPTVIYDELVYSNVKNQFHFVANRKHVSLHDDRALVQGRRLAGRRGRPGVPRKQTLRATPTGAHLHSAGPSRRPTFGAVSCANGVTGYWIDPNNNSTHDFALVPGSEIDVPTNGPGVWQFFINQPNALEAKGPALDSDRSFEFAVQRVNEAVVNTDGGRQSIYWNDKANAFSFHAVSDFHLYYLCGNGRSGVLLALLF